MVAAIVLAAGRSTRTGSNKLLLPLANGSAVIRTTMERLARARQHGLNDIVAVLGHEADLIKHELAGLPVRTVVNQRFLEGMSSSLKAGVRAMRRDAEAAMIVLGDQPLLSQAVIEQVIAVYRETAKPVVVPRYGEGQGHPVLFSAAVFHELMQVNGDKGGREVIARDSERVATVSFPAVLSPGDLDTWSDYEWLHEAVVSSSR